MDVGAIGQDALKETAYIGHLRQVDALIHVLRAFENDAIPHVGPIDPLRDIKNVEFDLMVSDLGQIEKRLERLEKDLKKMKTPELEKENELLIKAKAQLETEKPLREMEMTPEDKKRIRGFMFLSEKPMLYVLNIGESTELGKDLEEAVAKYNLSEVAARPNAGASAICGKVEAELAEMSDEDAAEFLVELRAERQRPVAADSQQLSPAGTDFIFHGGRRRVPRLDDSGEHARPERRGSDSLRPRTPFHSRRDDSLGSAAGSGFRGKRARQGNAAARRQRLHCAGRGRDAHTDTQDSRVARAFLPGSPAMMQLARISLTPLPDRMGFR